ncbi:MAG: ATP-binding protein [Methanobrevibacter sp.]|jgi:Mg-chelatase subunit ChlI|nr:ATP-binding protein [Candidatus Methanoflexus mossambicus]
MKNIIFPFSAIVGQEKIKKALILNAINPSIGGILIKGDRGTAKTTAVRALADLLPEIDVVENCPFNCDLESSKDCSFCSELDELNIVKKPMKVVELPLGATEDRVLGSIDIEKALHDGVKALEPGILAKANRNILYVDEINLLDDNLVDILLDAAAFGINVVEREGISIAHPSNFILVGTMNPEEGELRGQLSDRIGLTISVSAIEDIGKRILIIKRREEFEKDPTRFKNRFNEKDMEIQKKIIESRQLINNIGISDYLLEIIARVTLQVHSEGHRSDIAILKCSKAIAAYNSNINVSENDLEEAIELVLGENPIFQNNPNGVKSNIERAKKEIEKEMEKEKKNKNKNQENDNNCSNELNNQNNEKQEYDENQNLNNLKNQNKNQNNNQNNEEYENQDDSFNGDGNNLDMDDNSFSDGESKNQFNMNMDLNLNRDKNGGNSLNDNLNQSNFKQLDNKNNDNDLTFNQALNSAMQTFSDFDNDNVGIDIKKFW